jgi:precorrin-6B methylase 2
MSKKKIVEVNILVDDEHRQKMEELLQKLKGLGFVHSQSLEDIGVFSGTIPLVAMNNLSTVVGVVAVEENRNDYRTQIN